MTLNLTFLLFIALSVFVLFGCINVHTIKKHLRIKHSLAWKIIDFKNCFSSNKKEQTLHNFIIKNKYFHLNDIKLNRNIEYYKIIYYLSVAVMILIPITIIFSNHMF